METSSIEKNSVLQYRSLNTGQTRKYSNLCSTRSDGRLVHATRRKLRNEMNYGDHSESVTTTRSTLFELEC